MKGKGFCFLSMTIKILQRVRSIVYGSAKLAEGIFYCLHYLKKYGMIYTLTVDMYTDDGVTGWKR